MGRSRRAAVPRAGECKSKRSNKLVRLCSFFFFFFFPPLCLHTKTAGGNAKQPEVDIKLAKVVREIFVFVGRRPGVFASDALWHC